LNRQPSSLLSPARSVSLTAEEASFAAVQELASMLDVPSPSSSSWLGAWPFAGGGDDVDAKPPPLPPGTLPEVCSAAGLGRAAGFDCASPAHGSFVWIGWLSGQSVRQSVLDSSSTQLSLCLGSNPRRAADRRPRLLPDRSPWPTLDATCAPWAAS
jgi:hypothetical protein